MAVLSAHAPTQLTEDPRSVSDPTLHFKRMQKDRHSKESLAGMFHLDPHSFPTGKDPGCPTPTRTFNPTFPIIISQP